MTTRLLGADAITAAPPTKRIKTTMCRHFQKGFCQMGANCAFAHGEHELGSTLVQQQQLTLDSAYLAQAQAMGLQIDGAATALPVAHTANAAQQQTGVKTRMCTHFQAGACVRGQNCSFAHGEHEIGTSYVVPAAGTSLKTKVCSHFTNGHCTRGTNCTFAHGEHELGQPQPFQDQAQLSFGIPTKIADANGQVILLKTKLCVHFLAGSCTRGPLCSFAHGEHEIGSAQPPHIQQHQQAAQAAAAAGLPKPELVPPSREKKIPTLISAAAMREATQAKRFEVAAAEEERRQAQQAARDRAEALNMARAAQRSVAEASNGSNGAAVQVATAVDASIPVKTELCANFVNFGNCARGDLCPGAHGELELGQPIRSSASEPSESQPTQTESLAMTQNEASSPMVENEELLPIEDGQKKEPGKVELTNGSPHVPKMVAPPPRAQRRPQVISPPVPQVIAPPQRAVSSTSGAENGSAKAESSSNPCRYFLLTGHCKFGQDCKFVHGDRENGQENGISQAPRRYVKLTEILGKSEEKLWFHKTRVCANFQNGICAFGERCNYAHEGEEKVMKPGQALQEDEEIQKLFYHKTRLCGEFEAKGECSRRNCGFAHGNGELKQPGDMLGPEMRIMHGMPASAPDSHPAALADADQAKIDLEPNRSASANADQLATELTTESSPELKAAPLLEKLDLSQDIEATNNELSKLKELFNEE